MLRFRCRLRPPPGYGALTLAAFYCSTALAQATPPRPALTGISHISIHAKDMRAAERYYVDVVGCEEAADPEAPEGVRYYINDTQFIEVLPLAESTSPRRLDHLGYKTGDAEQLRLYLKSKGIAVPSAVHNAGDGSRWFDVKDPEGNTVQFLQPPDSPRQVETPNLVGHHLMNVGLLIHDQEKEDAFYRTILDFKPYWRGGLTDDKTDFVLEEVPEGRDYLEYEPVGSPSNTRSGENLSQRELGDLNHLSIAVVSMSGAYDTLNKEHRLASPEVKPRIARDGRWQLNTFDPDGTRLEYQEFSNVRAPCCSAFTAPHPSPTE